MEYANSSASPPETDHEKMQGTFEYIGTSKDETGTHPGIDVYAISKIVETTGNLVAMIYHCDGKNWKGRVILAIH